jgi:hypothetical protein
MPQEDVSLNKPHKPHKPQNNMSYRKVARSSLTFNLLAKSRKGKFVLAQAKNGSCRVLLAEQCSKEETLVLESRPNFSPTNHMKKLRDAKYHEISQCVVISYDKTKTLVVYNLKIWGIQWLTYSSFRKVLLEMKQGPEVDKFRLLFDKLKAGVDSGEIPASYPMNESDAEAAVSEPDRSEPGSNESEFATLLEEFAESAQRLIDCAKEKPTKVQRHILKMFQSYPGKTFEDFYTIPAEVQKLFARSTEGSVADGTCLMDKVTQLQLQANWELDASKPQIFDNIKKVKDPSKVSITIKVNVGQTTKQPI